MSSGYNYQGYGTQLPNNYPAGAHTQHMNYHHENLQNPSYPPPMSDEYLRQPAQAPYPSAPGVDMPQPQVVQMQPMQHLTHHHQQHLQQQHQQEPVIIVHNHTNEPDCCCECFRFCCSCLNGIVSGVCQIILAIIFFVGIIAIAVYFIKFYKHH